MNREFFEQVQDIFGTLVSGSSEQLRSRANHSGLKVWFGGDTPSRLHYEAQMLRRDFVDGQSGYVLEVGFHAEERDEALNQQVVDRLKSNESNWRPTLGAEAQLGEFFGAPGWRRLSDVWLDPELDDVDAAFEVASRLADYVNCIEPLLS